MANKIKFDKLGYIYKLMVIVALAITAVVLCRDIVVPLAFAAFLSVVMLPLVRRLEKKMGLTLAVTITLVTTIIVLGLLGWVLVHQIVGLANDLPNIQTKFDSFVEQVNATISDQLSMNEDEQSKMLQDAAKSVSGYVGAFLLSTTNTLSTLIQIPIYLFLLLIYREKFKQFFLALLPNNDEEMVWKKDIENVIQGYISGLLLVTLIIAALNNCWCSELIMRSSSECSLAC
jgi:putative heme transporter